MMDKGGSEEADPKQLEAEKEHLEAMAEQEAERKGKHQKAEIEREKERQRIRDKVRFKLKELFFNRYASLLSNRQCLTLQCVRSMQLRFI